jgi:transposase
MESPGVYGIPLFQILEARGFAVGLVHARYFQNVPGQRTDVSDGPWLRYLPAAGLLRPSLRPADQVCGWRSRARHRGSLMQTAATLVLRRHQALDQMHLPIHHVISDLTGFTGRKIGDAIPEGARDPQKLAALRDGRIQATEATRMKSWAGGDRREHRFPLRPSLAAYRHSQKLIAECDREMERPRNTFDARGDGQAKPLPAPKVRRHVLAEGGPDLSRFSSASACASGLGLCPDHDIPGGKKVAVGPRPVNHRAAWALRMAAQALRHSRSGLGDS